jgi:glyoxylase-like metal-dependent hydrolase (beta-lactamase superfamily II)
MRLAKTVLFALLVTQACNKREPAPEPLRAPSSKPPAPPPPPAEKWRAIRAIELSGSAHFWEPQQSVVADGPPRVVGNATFTLRDSMDGQASIAWKREVKYPFAKTYEYVNVLDATRGEVRGLDSYYFKEPPPPRPMSSDHFATAWREIHRISPLSYLTGRAPELEAELDLVTKLPVRLRSRDTDNIDGDSTLDLMLTDFRPEAALSIPRMLSYMLNGHTIAELKIERVRLNPTEPPPAPPSLPLLKSDANGGRVPFQWVLRREAMGGYSEDDSLAKQHLVRVTDGVFLVAGRTHNALIVELSDRLVVVDAPLDNAYSKWVLDTCRERFPMKPVTTLVLTHHHNDHCGGAREFVAAGVDVIVGASNQQYFTRMFTAAHELDKDTLQQAPKPAHITEVAEGMTLQSASRTLQLLRIPNHHAEGMLVAFLPKERIAFVADLWSPERDELRAPLTFERHKDLVDALRAAKVTPKLVVGGHGSVGNYAELATAVDAGPLD